MVEVKWTEQIEFLFTFLSVLGWFRHCGSTTTAGGGFGGQVQQQARYPKLLVFSLDQVIWPFRVDQDVATPVKKNKRTGTVRDFVLKDLGVYSSAVDALNTLYLKKYRMAAISGSPDVETNSRLLLFFNLYNYFPIQEFFGGPKIEHLELIHRTTQTPYEDIMFFDVNNDQNAAIRDLGVNVVEVNEGLDIADFNMGLETYTNKYQNTSLTNTSTLSTNVL